jgi:hypothetical protein
MAVAAFRLGEQTLDGLRHWLAGCKPPFRSADGDWLQRGPSRLLARIDLPRSQQHFAQLPVF